MMLSRTRTLLACLCFYTIACILVMLLPDCRRSSFAEGIASFFLVFLLLPGVSFAISYTLHVSYGGSVGGYLPAAILCGYVAHIGLLLTTSTAAKWFRHVAFWAFVALLVFDVYNVFAGLWVILPGE
jgi:hypothetical protein